MEVHRISISKYANSLRASGAENRWNRKGEYVIYTGSSRALSSLELLVNRSLARFNGAAFKTMIISISDNEDLYTHIKKSDLPKNWRSRAAYSVLQRIGSEWYQQKKSLVLKIPSAVIPFEYNYAINSEHPEFSTSVELIRQEPFFWDERL